MAGRTVFVIAHRLSTVRRADRIVVLESGTITDIGAHEEVMTRLGTYRRLYDLQFVEVETPKMVQVGAKGGMSDDSERGGNGKHYLPFHAILTAQGSFDCAASSHSRRSCSA